MNINGWRIIYSLICLQCLVFPLATASQAGSCFSSSFSRAIGYILRGFVLGEMQVASVIECKRRCVISANCLSLNILSNADGSFMFMCQLNSDLKENGAKEQFVQHGPGEYYGLKKKRLCEDNGKTCDTDSSWFAFNQSYFQFVTAILTPDEARKVCQEKKGDLASTSSEEEQTFLYKTFMETNDNAGNEVYVGLNDIAEEGVFVWNDGSPNTYARFQTGEPTNRNDEDCVTMRRIESGAYGDRPCDGAHKFFCETNYKTLYP